MTTLFDVTPDEPARKRTGRKRQVAEEAKTVAAPVACVAVATHAPVLGRLDDLVECVDQDCQGTAHEIVEEGRYDLAGQGAMEPAWRIECCFCGCAQWTRPIKGHLQPVEKAFLFRDGRFAGLSPDEAARMPRGPEYLKWAAENHPRQSVRAAVKKHLDQASSCS